MDIMIDTPGFKIGDTLDLYIREKVGKLSTKSDRIIRAQVALYMGPPSDPENKHCEIRLEMPGKDPFVKKNGSTYELAIVEAVNTLSGILQKTKEKITDRRP